MHVNEALPEVVGSCADGERSPTSGSGTCLANLNNLGP